MEKRELLSNLINDMIRFKGGDFFIEALKSELRAEVASKGYWFDKPKKPLVETKEKTKYVQD